MENSLHSINTQSTTKTEGKSTCQIFEYQWTDYKDLDVTDDWLISRFYELVFE